MFNGRQNLMTQPDPQVTPKAERRRFNTEYKLRILSEADACTERGQLGALLRREGLYSSHLEKWREQRARCGVTGCNPSLVLWLHPPVILHPKR